jgi:hypothetical protein
VKAERRSARKFGDWAVQGWHTVAHFEIVGDDQELKLIARNGEEHAAVIAMITPVDARRGLTTREMHPFNEAAATIAELNRTTVSVRVTGNANESAIQADLERFGAAEDV